MLNILSIDWDYFFDATEDQRIFLFPDNPNELLPDHAKKRIWASYYAMSEEYASKVANKPLEKIKVDPLIYKVVKAIKNPLAFAVSESHTRAYYYIKDLLSNELEDCVNLLNIDYHHDCGGHDEGLPNVHCGNWLKRLMDEVDGTYVWLGRKDSDKCENIRKLKFISDYNAANIENTLWDMVFICRSDMWSPPHLDKEFTKIFKPLAETDFEECLYYAVEDGIWEDRYPDVAELVEERRILKQIPQNP